MTLEEKIKYLKNKNLYLEAKNEYLKKLRTAATISGLKRSTYYYTLSKTHKDMKNY